MIETVETHSSWTLARYASFPQLAQSVRALRAEAALLIPTLRTRRIWMVNSTARGGGVAEMMPAMVQILRELGVETHWIVMGSDRPEFFELTKRLHNLVHGSGDPELTTADRELYEAVNRENADELAGRLAPDDLLVVHDPQPLAMGDMLAERLGVRTVWRCHIGHDRSNAQTRAAWEFMRPWLGRYRRAVFSASDYIPDALTGRVQIIRPALDPCSHKNRDLQPHKLVGVMCNSGLMPQEDAVLTPDFGSRVERLCSDGRFRPRNGARSIGLLYRPIVTQVSRWDRLKGFAPLMQGFVQLKRSLGEQRGRSPRQERRLEILRLVLAGPDPESIQDDPEGRDVLAEIVARYRELPHDLQEDVAVLSLPMQSRKENALMVNALQRCSTVIVQNSLREGFGLTATEAMWKGVPVVGTRACGLRQQIRHGIDGMLIQDAEDPAEIAHRLEEMLGSKQVRETLSKSAQQRVFSEFLIFTQLTDWLRCLSDVAAAPPPDDDEG